MDVSFQPVCVCGVKYQIFIQQSVFVLSFSSTVMTHWQDFKLFALFYLFIYLFLSSLMLGLYLGTYSLKRNRFIWEMIRERQHVEWKQRHMMKSFIFYSFTFPPNHGLFTVPFIDIKAKINRITVRR